MHRSESLMSSIFASLGSQKPLTARKVHIRRLYDLFQICIQRNDIPRARRAWSILARCKEVDWMSMWTTCLPLLVVVDGINLRESTSKELDFLRTMMLQNPDERESIFKELILRLILSGRHRDALDELELYLPSFPYQDNPVLHIYAGFIALYLAQPSEPSGGNSMTFSTVSLRDAQGHFERARALDPDNAVAQAFLQKIATLSGVQNSQDILDSDEDPVEEEVPDEEDMVVVDLIPPRPKRSRASYRR